jgi:hypothetical protein
MLFVDAGRSHMTRSFIEEAFGLAEDDVVVTVHCKVLPRNFENPSPAFLGGRKVEVPTFNG